MAGRLSWPSICPQDRNHRVAVTALPVQLQTRQGRHLLASRMFGEHGRLAGLPVENHEGPVEHDVVVRRVEEDEVGGTHGVRGCLEPPHHVTADKPGAFLEAERVQVLAQDSKTARLLVHERD